MLPTQGGDSDIKSVIAPGTVNINDPEGQLDKTGKTVEETLATLNRDVDNAHQPLEKIYDAKAVKRKRIANAHFQ